MRWIWLALAIVFEVMGTTSLKLASGEGPGAAWWWVGVGVGCVCCFGMLGVCMKHFELGTLYATWSGVGVALLAIVGLVAFGDSLSALKLV